MKPQRGEIWWVAFNPSVGSETQKVRPAVVISNNQSNKHLDRFQVVPLTTTTDRLYRGEALVAVKEKSGKAMCNQLTTSSIKRFKKKLAILSTSEMKEVEQAVRVQLGLL